MANGRVITGFSKPYVALYNNNAGAISYSNGTPLARGVDVSFDPETSEDNNFYADNVLAESAGATFTGGTATFTIDGLKDEVRKMIMGLPTEESIEVDGTQVKIYSYDNRQNIPYVGVGFVVKVMENGVESYVPYIFTKAQFHQDGLEAATQEEEIDFQTSEIEASILRDDTTNQAWRKIGEEQTTEAKAEAVIQAILGA